MVVEGGLGFCGERLMVWFGLVWVRRGWEYIKWRGSKRSKERFYMVTGVIG